MKKKLSVLLISIISIVLVIFLAKKYIVKTPYQKAVANFETVSVEEIEEKLEKGEDFVLYIGRETCPGCVEFVPVLEEVVKTNKLNVLYLDSTDTENKPDVQSFRNKYEIEFVPSIFIYENGDILQPSTPDNSLDMEKLLKAYGVF